MSAAAAVVPFLMSMRPAKNVVAAGISVLYVVSRCVVGTPALEKDRTTHPQFVQLGAE